MRPAVSTTTGIEARASRVSCWERKAQPSMPGIHRSSRIKWGGPGAEQLKSLCAISGGLDFETLSIQREQEQVANVWIVIDDQNATPQRFPRPHGVRPSPERPQTSS